MPNNRLGHDDQPAPMPRGYGEGLPGPEIVRMVDGHSFGVGLSGQNPNTPFGDTDDADEPTDSY